MRFTCKFLLALACFSLNWAACAGDFGTLEGCTAVGGTFRFGAGYGAWQGSCYIVTTVQDCVARGGGRTALADGSVECNLPIDLIDLKNQCAAAGGVWGRQAKTARMDYCHIERYVSDCRSKGGTWEARGRLGVPGCVLYAKDAGKPCERRSECEFACLYIGSPPLPGAEVKGQCARDNSPFGCRSFVEGSRLVA